MSQETSPPPPAPSALLFDLDGTLVDSRRDIAEACNGARIAHGRPPLAFDVIVPMIGDGARALVARAFDAAEDEPIVDAALATFRRLYLARPCVHTTLLPGAREVLEVAKEEGLPCALVTNKPRDVSIEVLEALGVARYFRAIWGGGDGPLKPSPAGVLDAAARLGVAPASAWMIGDGPQDIAAGRAAGTFTVYVPGIAARELLARSDPDMACESLADVAVALRRSLAAGVTARRA